MQALTWEGARQKCQEDGGDLVCFGNQQERDYFTNECDGCWVGYSWKDGRFVIDFNFIVICRVNLSTIYYVRFMEKHSVPYG